MEDQRKPLDFDVSPDHITLGLGLGSRVGLGLWGSSTTTFRAGGRHRHAGISFASNNFATSAALADVCTLPACFSVERLIGL